MWTRSLQWSYIAPGLDPLSSGGHGQKARWLSKLLDSSAHGFPTAISQQWSPAQSHLCGRSLAKGPWQTLNCSIKILIKAQRGTRSCETTPTAGSLQRWTGSEVPPTNGKKSEVMGGSPWEDASWGSVSPMLRPCNMPSGRWWPSGCPLPNMRPLVGGMLHPGSEGCVPRISCPVPMPQALRSSGLWGRWRPWPWPVHCRPVQKGQGCWPEFYTIQWENSKDAWAP